MIVTSLLISVFMINSDLERYKEVIAIEPVYATNVHTEDHQLISSSISSTKYGIPVTYKIGNEIYKETVYVEKRDFEKYKDRDHFYFRKHTFTTEESGTITNYYIDEVRKIDFINMGPFLIFNAFFLLVEGVLILGLSQTKKKKT